MSAINQLLQSLAKQENQLQNTQFLAPCVKSGYIRTRIQGMVYGFTPEPKDFEGWGIFQPADTQSATLIESAEIWQIDEYLQALPAIRVRLVYQLQNQTWLAYPINEADMRQRFGTARPIVIHLVSEGTAFDAIIVRCLGAAFYFEMRDRKADPEPAEQLQTNLQQLTPIADLCFSGLTPEMRTTYELVARQTEEFPLPARTNHPAPSTNPRPVRHDEKRLRDALLTGGGFLDRYEDRGDYWTVEWRTSDGEAHTSAIAKRDLTVVTAGICLDGFDENFDLQSLVGVVEQQWDD
ncbi:hypothetical protein IQ266_07520 [filamentous cyanobacterium LEGE 11480]|uniref:Uncharacterized protein n=1 Tax=Romeriopsis navalis LEGE 11480 TaxID=2777977 RepID=A0A928VMU2_9CYAN|nr:hypothetical protein [Romeriopsis navalis]MBE9029576.1 hypothetical protein [Romeriopsis navalis LEGE 11480]